MSRITLILKMLLNSVLKKLKNINAQTHTLLQSIKIRVRSNWRCLVYYQLEGVGLKNHYRVLQVRVRTLIKNVGLFILFYFTRYNKIEWARCREKGGERESVK